MVAVQHINDWRIANEIACEGKDRLNTCTLIILQQQDLFKRKKKVRVGWSKNSSQTTHEYNNYNIIIKYYYIF